MCRLEEVMERDDVPVPGGYSLQHCYLVSDLIIRSLQGHPPSLSAATYHMFTSDQKLLIEDFARVILARLVLSIRGTGMVRAITHSNVDTFFDNSTEFVSRFSDRRDRCLLCATARLASLSCLNTRTTHLPRVFPVLYCCELNKGTES